MDEGSIEADEGVSCPSGRWRWTVVPLYGLTFVGNVCVEVGTLFANLAQEVASHYNYQSEREARDRFERDADRELQALWKTSEED